jgi:hypothetical protein
MSSANIFAEDTAFWEVMPCNLVCIQRCFSTTSVNICQTTWRHIPEHNNHYNHRSNTRESHIYRRLRCLTNPLYIKSRVQTLSFVFPIL